MSSLSELHLSIVIFLVWFYHWIHWFRLLGPVTDIWIECLLFTKTYLWRQTDSHEIEFKTHELNISGGNVGLIKNVCLFVYVVGVTVTTVFAGDYLYLFHSTLILSSLINNITSTHLYCYNWHDNEKVTYLLNPPTNIKSFSLSQLITDSSLGMPSK